MPFLLKAIYITPAAKAPPRAVDEARAIRNRGLEGDRYAAGEGTFSRWPEPGKEVTLIAAEALRRLEEEFAVSLAPGEHRRNLVAEGGDLEGLIGRRFRIGGAVFWAERRCLPCRFIERHTGRAGLHEGLKAVGGGLRARVLEGGLIRAGDAIEAIDKEPLGRLP